MGRVPEPACQRADQATPIGSPGSGPIRQQ